MRAVERAIEVAKKELSDVEVIEKKVSRSETSYAKVKVFLKGKDMTVRLEPNSGRVDLTVESVDGSGFWFQDPAQLSRVNPEDMGGMIVWALDQHLY